MFRMFTALKKSREILGMNARNLTYIRPHNRKYGMRLADDKLLCKRVLKRQGLAVPALIARIRNEEELSNFDWSQLPSSFALKPNRGFGGGGILVVYGRKKGRTDAWVKADGSIVTVDDLVNHIQNILDGSFSLANIPDTAFFEERLRLLKSFKPYTFKGIPDIRVIVFNRVPVMAMLRLPTRASEGRANLQQGAIGVGIDLATGVTTTAILGKGHVIEHIPDTRLVLSGIRIPYWKEILQLAVDAQEVSGLGFLGADIAIDRERGPVILELNARPGLSIQLANLSGLKGRLERVEGLKIKTTERGIRVGMNLFGGEIEEGIEEISGRKVIGSIEKVAFLGKEERSVEAEAKIDTGAESTSISRELAVSLGFEDLLETFDSIEQPLPATREEARLLEGSLRKKYADLHPDLEDLVFIYASNGVSLRPKVKLTFILDGIEVAAKATISARSGMKYPAIIGKRSLRKFLIDVSK